MREGVAPQDIAVLVRGGGRATAVLAQGLADYGVPVAPDARVPLRRTRLGAGVMAFARAALPGGEAGDVLSWLRTPGKLADADAADALEARMRRGEAVTAADARRAWAAVTDAPSVLEALDALAAAADEGPVAFLDALLAEAEAIWTAPHLRRAAVLGRADAADARAAAELRAAAGELRSLAAADPDLLGTPAELLDALGDVKVREDAGAHEAGVLVADALAIRARRFRAVFVCGLQDGEFPRRPVPEPFLDDDDRAELAKASGLVLRRHEDVLGEERYLLYACVSRPEEVLFLSFRSSDEEGDPAQPSPFVDDVRALFTDELWEQRGTRLLAEVTWPPATAPTPHELRRARAAAEHEPEPDALAAPGIGRGPRAAGGARRRARARAGDVRRLRRALAGRERPEGAARGAGPRADAARLGRPRGARAHAARPARAHRLGAAGAGHARGGAGRAAGRARGAARRRRLGPRRRRARPRCGAGAGGGPRALPAPRGRDRRGAGAGVAGMELRRQRGRARAAAARRRGARGHRPRGPDRRRRRRPRDRARLQGQDGVRGRALGAGPPAPGRAVRARGPRAARAGRRRRALPADRPQRPPPARDGRGGACRAATSTATSSSPSVLEAALGEARALAVRSAREMHAGAIRPCPSRCSPTGCAYPAICRAAEGAAVGEDAA